MLVHFIGSSKNLGADHTYLRKITEIVNDQGGIFTRNWVAAAHDENGKIKKDFQNDDRTNWRDVFAENLSALDRSDVVIIEGTTYGFQQGFYTSHAIKSKKPTLLLFRSDQNNHPITGFNDRWLTIKKYKDIDELEKTTKKFLKDNTIATKDLRFNFFIDRQIYSYLRDVSYETGKNKSEIIRELLENEIDRQDKS